MVGVVSGYFAPFHVTNVAFPVVDDDGIHDLIDAGTRCTTTAGGGCCQRPQNGNQFGVRLEACGSFS